VLSTVNHWLNFISSGKRMYWSGEREGGCRAGSDAARGEERRGERKASSRDREAWGGVNKEGAA
jgi:hypothetical protein